MDDVIAYGLMIGTLGFFGYVGYQAATEKELDQDAYLSARGCLLYTSDAADE